MNYYNEIEPFPCEVLRKHIRLGNIAPGVVDQRDVRDVQACELEEHNQVHLFAGIGGAAYAARLAEAEHLNLWTFGFPCQDISSAGKREGLLNGQRSSLFFEVVRLLKTSVRRPRWLLAENVHSLWECGAYWVKSDLEACGYRVWALGLAALHVGAPHERKRVWFVAADRDFSGISSVQSVSIHGLRAFEEFQNIRGIEELRNRPNLPTPLLCRTDDGIPHWVDRLKGLGNAWVPQCAALIMRWMVQAEGAL